MNEAEGPDEGACDVLVVGAGLAGLTAAIAFAQAGFRVVSCGADERIARGRTVAMLDRSVAYLESLGVWAAIEPSAAPMRGLRLIDDTGTLFPPRPVEFHSSEIGLETFGWNVENDRMADALAGCAERTPGLERIRTPVAAYEFAGETALARLEDGRAVAAALVVGADGRASHARRAAGLSMRAHRYPQSALTALLTHRLPHRDTSTEFHTRQGPFTLVPLPPARSGAGPLEPRLGHVGRRGAPARGARRRRAGARDRAPGPLDAGRDAARRTSRRLSHGAPGRAAHNGPPDSRWSATRRTPSRRSGRRG